jgi:hypothetical protein
MITSSTFQLEVSIGLDSLELQFQDATGHPSRLGTSALYASLNNARQYLKNGYRDETAA